MCTNEMPCRLPCGFDVEFPPVMEHQVRRKWIFRFTAMHLVYVLLALAVETCVEIHRDFLTAKNGDIIRKFAVDTSAKAESVDIAVCFYIEAEHIRMNACIRP